MHGSIRGTIIMPYFTTSDDIQLYYKSWGSGKPVILIHGWPLSADSLDDQALALAEAGFNAITYDRRGFGRSDQPWDGYDYDTLSDDLADLIHETAATEATLVGFSMGGGEVLRYMSRHRTRGICEIVLISSVVPYLLKTKDNPKGIDQSVFNDMEASIRKDRAAFFEDFFKDFYGVGYVPQPVSDRVIEASWMTAMQAGLRPTLECLKSFSSTDFRADLAAIDHPTLIIHGTADKTVPIEATAREVFSKLPAAKLVEYDGAPHGLLETHKDRVTRDLLSFLSQSASAKA
jgi:pimeloyl-ACP methyl ester carboxylesterase